MMFRLIASLAVLAFLTGCASSQFAAGYGSSDTGKPITAKYTAKINPSDSTFDFDMLLISASGKECTAKEKLKSGQLVYRMSVTCSEGVTGSMTFTTDFVNRRDNVIYKLSDGEKGRITFGAMSAVVNT